MLCPECDVVLCPYQMQKNIHTQYRAKERCYLCFLAKAVPLRASQLMDGNPNWHDVSFHLYLLSHTSKIVETLSMLLECATPPLISHSRGYHYVPSCRMDPKDSEKRVIERLIVRGRGYNAGLPLVDKTLRLANAYCTTKRS